MKNSYIVILFITLIFACSEVKMDLIQPNNDLKEKGFIGKINLIEVTNYEVVEYKFGKPIFEKRYSKKEIFNKSGYTTKYNFIYTSKYVNSLYSTLITYHIPSLGLVSKIIEHSETQYPPDKEKSILTLSQIFIIDSISNKITNSKTTDITDRKFYYDEYTNKRLSDLKRNPEIIKNFIYKPNEDRVSSYERNSLKELEVIKYDKKGRVLRTTKYDENGNENYENYLYYNKDIIVRDSTIKKKDKETTIIDFDSLGRVVNTSSNKIPYDFKYQYDNNNINSSFDILKISRENSITLKKERVEVTLDSIGNIVEKVKTNMDTKKIVEKTNFKYKYY